MKKLLFIILGLILGCADKKSTNQIPIQGTWKLISGTLIEKGDTTTTDYTVGQSFIKIINESHFAFLKHNTTKTNDTLNGFSAGGGKYTLEIDNYSEHLEYCNDAAWEGHNFHFTITVKNDTLIQTGREIIEKEGINRMNIEKYARLK